jgi:hypothetical protein
MTGTVQKIWAKGMTQFTLWYKRITLQLNVVAHIRVWEAKVGWLWFEAAPYPSAKV